MKQIVFVGSCLMAMMLSGSAMAQEAETFMVQNADGLSLCYAITSRAEKQVAVRATAGINYEGVLSIPDSVKFGEEQYAVTAIEERGFAGQSKLTTVELPVALKAVGDRAFEDCGELEMVKSFANVPPSANAEAFEACDMSRMLLEVPCKSADQYAASCVWGKCGEIGEDCNAALERALADDVTVSISRHNGITVQCCRVHDIRVYDNYGRLVHISHGNGAQVSVTGRCTLQIDDRPAMELLLSTR